MKECRPKPCKECKGLGYFLYDAGPGRFDSWSQVWLPSDYRMPCNACRGTGEVSSYTDTTSVEQELNGDKDSPF